MPLRPGTYHLALVCKDDVSGGFNTYASTITVPDFATDKLSTSTLILADDIETLPMRNIGTGQFVIGATKVRPRIGGRFRTDESLGVYMTVYNLGQLQWQVEYQVARAGTGEVVITTTENASARQVTLQKLLRLENLSPGSYILRVRLPAFEKSAPFTVTLPPQVR